MRVVLGAHRLQEPEASQQIFSVAESIAHPLYNPRAVDNDIRLLRVSLHRAHSSWAEGYPTALGCEREVGCPTAPGHREGGWVPHGPGAPGGGGVPHEGPSRH